RSITCLPTVTTPTTTHTLPLHDALPIFPDTPVTTQVGKKSTRRAFGWYLNSELQPWRRWAVGARYDASQFPTQPGFEWAIEPYVTFFPSEFLRFRLAYKNTERDRTQISPFNQNNAT